jgi:hypothetical protein
MTVRGAAADDTFIFVWTQVDGGTARVFGSEETVHESWKVVKTLRGHAGGTCA